MPDFKITFARSARKELEKLPPQIADRILDEIESLEKNPRPAGSIKLKDFKTLWRIRVGDYRVVYEVDPTGVPCGRHSHPSPQGCVS